MTSSMQKLQSHRFIGFHFQFTKMFNTFITIRKDLPIFHFFTSFRFPRIDFPTGEPFGKTINAVFTIRYYINRLPR